jgi:Domain of unknown function (DUF4340)
MKTFFVQLTFFSLIALFLTACGGDTSTTMAGEDNDFRVEDTAAITRIFLADRNGSTVKIDRVSPNYWKLNDKYRANQHIVSNILGTLHDVRVRFSINESAQKNVEYEMATDGVKVEVYQGTKKKTFYVGGPTPDQMGTHMYMEGAKKIYVTYIANWEGVLTSRFLTDPVEMRSADLLDTENIAEVAVEYPLQREHSFRVLTQGEARVEPFYVSTPATAKPLQKQLVRSFLDNLNKVIAAKFVNTLPGKDSILQTTPFCKITLRNTKNELQTMSVFRVPLNAQPFNPDQASSTDRFYCAYANAKAEKDFVLTYLVSMKNIMWSYSSFYTEPAKIQGNQKPREQRFK